MNDSREYLKSRVYYAAKDGLALPLYMLLFEFSQKEAEKIINEVSRTNLRIYNAHSSVFVLCEGNSSLVNAIAFLANVQF